MPNMNQPGEFLIDESCLNSENETYLINPDDFIEPEVTDEDLEIFRQLSEPVNMGKVYFNRGVTLDSPTTKSLMKLNKCYISPDELDKQMDELKKKNRSSFMYKRSVEYYLENAHPSC